MSKPSSIVTVLVLLAFVCGLTTASFGAPVMMMADSTQSAAPSCHHHPASPKLPSPQRDHPCCYAGSGTPAATTHVTSQSAADDVTVIAVGYSTASQPQGTGPVLDTQHGSPPTWNVLRI